MLGFTGTWRRRRLRVAALIAALALAAGGLTLAGLAGAQDQPSVRQAAYPNECDPGQYFVLKITKHPKKKTTKKTANFAFKAFYCNTRTENTAVKLKCKLDNAKYKKCTSPKRYRHLRRGRHTFKVKGTWFKGSTPQTDSFKWRIKRG